MPPLAPIRAADLLGWYDASRRTMPWRAAAGQRPDPYRVWLSEVMLQQTTVAAVSPRFGRFLAEFPTVGALAAAPQEAVLRAWAGLGYYARARNLHACARVVAAAGEFPRDVRGLRALPGVGPYTAAAVASIAFGVPVVPVDGNVERIAARLFAIDRPLPSARPALTAAAAGLGRDPDAAARPADFAQALFDLGATVCTPRRPACGACPWRAGCAARQSGRAESLPRRLARPLRPLRHGAHFWLEDVAGQVLLRRRPPRGLLGGMLELPGTGWDADTPLSEAAALAAAPQAAAWALAGSITHVFTHFALQVAIYAARVRRIEAAGLLHPAADLAGAGLPSLMRRCAGVAAGSMVRSVPGFTAR